MLRHFAPLTLALLLAACGDGEPLLPADAVLPDGGRYRGEVVDGRLQGEGRLDYANGAYYQGQFKDGLFEGPGTWQGAGGERYTGQFHLGLFHGQGELVYADGTRYQGGFKQGRMHGEGHLQQGGVSYRGEFRDDRYHGLGTLEWPDGSRYQGRFVRGEPEGEGLRSNAEGQFSGTFKNGMLQGEGSYQGEDGERYSGGFRNDQFHGKGRYQSGEGEVWSGHFANGELTETELKEMAIFLTHYLGFPLGSKLDGVVSSGFSISRQKAADAVTAGRVEVNWLACAKPDDIAAFRFQLARFLGNGDGGGRLHTGKGVGKKGHDGDVLIGFKDGVTPWTRSPRLHSG